MMLRRTSVYILSAVIATAMASMLTSCFTGVESTPKITARDIRARNAVASPEDLFLADLDSLADRPLTIGRHFIVIDDRISLAMSPAQDSDFPEHLKGSVLTLSDITYEPTITGVRQAVLGFSTPDSRRILYRTGIADTAFASHPVCYVPFTIDYATVDSVNTRLRGKQYYILVSQRLGDDGSVSSGLRYIHVTIDSVVPSFKPIPLEVRFTEPDGRHAAVLMSPGSGPKSTRNFATLFAFTDPRLRYKQIEPDVWDDIMHSRIRLGMTPVECRLALGSPDNYSRYPSTMGMVEFWQYDNGKYLYFEDGTLVRFRN